MLEALAVAAVAGPRLVDDVPIAENHPALADERRSCGPHRYSDARPDANADISTAPERAKADAHRTAGVGGRLGTPDVHFVSVGVLTAPQGRAPERSHFLIGRAIPGFARLGRISGASGEKYESE